MADTPSAENRLEPGKVMAFARNLEHVGQQKESRLVPYVDAELNSADVGDRWTDELLETSDPRDAPLYIAPSPEGSVGQSRRVAFWKGYEDGNFVSTREKAEKLVDPTNGVVQAMGFGRERRRDQRIIAALHDKVQEVDKDGDVVAKAFPAGNVIAVNDWSYHKGKADGVAAPTGDAPLTVAKLRNAKTKLSKAKISGERIIFVEEEDLQNLLTSTEINSIDYNRVRPLVDGEIDMFMGFKFARAESGVLRTSGSNGLIPAFIKPVIKYKDSNLVVARVNERADKSYNWYAYYAARDSVLRTQDAGVVHITCVR